MTVQPVAGKRAFEGQDVLDEPLLACTSASCREETDTAKKVKAKKDLHVRVGCWSLLKIQPNPEGARMFTMGPLSSPLRMPEPYEGAYLPFAIGSRSFRRHGFPSGKGRGQLEALMNILPSCLFCLCKKTLLELPGAYSNIEYLPFSLLVATMVWFCLISG